VLHSKEGCWLNLRRFTREEIKSPAQRSQVENRTEEEEEYEEANSVQLGLGKGRRRGPGRELGIHNDEFLGEDGNWYPCVFFPHSANWTRDAFSSATCMTIDRADEMMRPPVGGPLPLVAVHEAWMGNAPSVEELMAAMISESEHLDPDVIAQEGYHNYEDYIENDRPENEESGVFESSELSRNDHLYSEVQVSAVRISEVAAGDVHLH
jgi:hypothetical protein